MLVGNSACGWYADRGGRKRTLVISIATFSVFTALTALAVGLYSAIGLRFVTEVRSTGLGLTGSIGKVAAAAGPVFFGTLTQFGYLVALAPVAVSLFVAGVALLVWGSETKGETLL